MTVGKIIKVSDSSEIPYSKLTIKQTWGREVPTVGFTSRPTLSLIDDEAIQITRDDVALMNGIVELYETTSQQKQFTARIDPVTFLFRYVQPTIWDTDPAWLLKMLNQPVKARLLPYVGSRYEKFDNFANTKTNWKIGGNWASIDIFYGVPAPWSNDLVVNHMVGMTTDNHEPGVGVLCFGYYAGTDGIWLTAQTPFADADSQNSETIVARVKVNRAVVHRCFLALMDSQPTVGGKVGYLFEVDFDSTTNNLKLYKVPSSANPAGWTVLTQGSKDLTAEIGNYLWLKFSRRNRGTSGTPHWYFICRVFQGDGTETYLSEVTDDTYFPHYACIGCRGNGVAGGQVHLHLDKAAYLLSDKPPSDKGISADIYPWIVTKTGLAGGAAGLGSDLLDDALGTAWQTSSNQALNDKVQYDMAAQKNDICRVDVICEVDKYPENIKIELSNDDNATPTNWTNVWSKTGSTSPEVYAVFAPTQARHVRAILTAAGSRKWLVKEVRIYQSDGNPTLTLGTIVDFGAALIVQSNWSSIWDLLHDLSDATGFHAWLGPRAGTLNFSATRGTDLSATIKFAEGRNISTYRHTRNLLEKVDRVWVIGAQVGEEQVYGVKATDPLPTNYRERVFSAKSISDPIVLQTLAETLYTVLNSAIEQITLTVRDGYATGAYDVGDTVQIDIPSKSVSGSIES